jgi:hypothetical protein
VSDPETGFVGGMQDVFGGEVKFFAVHGRVTIDTSGLGIVLGAAQREQYAQLLVASSHEADAQEAARASAAGQVARAHPDGYGDTATCKHCRKPIARCATLPGHAGCRSGYGWIHSNADQWGHTCQPRSSAPCALPAPMPGQVTR